MRKYRPNTPFATAMQLLVPTSTMVKGVRKDTWTEGLVFNGSFRTWGGTDSFNNDVYTVVATGTIDTWYDPSIKSNCRVKIIETGEVYDIINEPEDINMRHQFLQFRVQKVGGKP